MLTAGIVVLAVALCVILLQVFLRSRPKQSSANQGSVLAVCGNSRYKPGQVWSLRIPQAPQARLTVLRVESLSTAGTIVHVAVSDMPVPVGHMPFSEAAIDQSVVELVGTDAVPPEALEGYDDWRKAFENEGAGVFSVTVPDALAAVFGGVREQP